MYINRIFLTIMQKERSGVLNFDETCQLWDELLFWKVRSKVTTHYIVFFQLSPYASFRAGISCQINFSLFSASHGVCIRGLHSMVHSFLSLVNSSSICHVLMKCFPTVSFHLNVDRTATRFPRRYVHISSSFGILLFSLTRPNHFNLLLLWCLL